MEASDSLRQKKIKFFCPILDTSTCLPPYILYEYGKEGNIRRNPEIYHGTYGYQCDFKCLYALKVRGCGERNKASGKRRKRTEKMCTIKG